MSTVPDDALELIRSAEYTFRAQLADTWRHGNIFLLGDAAHLTPPFIGQGLCAGLRDAMNLTWKVAGVLRGSLPTTVLDTYEQERKPHVRSVLRLALWMGWAMTSGGDVGNLIRRMVVPHLNLVPGLRHKIVDSRTPALHRSALIVKSRTPRQLAGTLCPNLLLSTGNRLDATLGNGFGLITTKPLSPAERTLLELRGVTVHVAENGSELADWLRRSHATAAVIRPDRTVMCAGRHVRPLCEAVPAFHLTSGRCGSAPQRDCRA